MKLRTRSRSDLTLPGLLAPARSDRRTRALIARLRPGDIAVLDHLDLDRASAQALVDAQVSAVVNASPMISGRYPNLGPAVLTAADVVVVDQAGPDLLARVKDGARVRLHDGELFDHHGELIASGRLLDGATVQELMADAKEQMAVQLGSFTHNSTEFLRRESGVLLNGVGVPVVNTDLVGRPAVVTVSSHDHVAELAGIRRFVRERKPVLIGVEDGADALVKAGHTPDIIIVAMRHGDHDLPSVTALRSARDIVALTDPGSARSATESLERLGVRCQRFETTLTPEDAALVIADAGETSLIVGVGMHATLEDFLDRQRAGLASTYLTRLKVGPRLVDAAAVPTLYSGRVRPRHVLLVMILGLLALGAAIATTPVGQEWVDTLLTWVRSALTRIG